MFIISVVLLSIWYMHFSKLESSPSRLHQPLWQWLLWNFGWIFLFFSFQFRFYFSAISAG